MNATQLKKFCNDLPAATSRLVAPPANVLVYSIGEKNFAWFKTSDPEKWRFSFRVSPDRFIELTDMPGIKPARYMSRFHWVTVVDVRSMPEAYLKELVQWAYEKALASLSARRRKELLASF
ncbi:MmcQ/YjbR family DNA-binding protein [Herbaspirillum lusitanum]|jgi:predicted DNA-binding protein (MmcQ/YjbR family)|uniref:MmcQ/YjbR family DNA-binding protein n=1 Tax=Herbaspirillum lusitanum TaxID=213312 RepID=A0ABW9A9Y0_9BURK